MASDWFDGGSSGSEVDVEALLINEHVQRGFASIVQAGALLSLGTTSDGGALGVTITVDGTYRREYVRGEDELLTTLAEAIPAVESRKGLPRPSGGQRQRKRRS
jgi:hypothetical protein